MLVTPVGSASAWLPNPTVAASTGPRRQLVKPRGERRVPGSRRTLHNGTFRETPPLVPHTHVPCPAKPPLRFTRRSRPSRSADSFPCPHCGGDVPPRRRACPHCGASESDGWPRNWSRDDDDRGDDDRGHEEELRASEAEEDDFDYDEFVAREFGEGGDRTGVPSAIPKRLLLWLIVAAMLLASLSLLG